MLSGLRESRADSSAGDTKLRAEKRLPSGALARWGTDRKGGCCIVDMMGSSGKLWEDGAWVVACGAKDRRVSVRPLSKSEFSLEASFDSSLDSTFSFWWRCVWGLDLSLALRLGEE